MEGFLGYITQQQQSELAHVLQRLSAPGSRVAASGPPSEEVRQRMAGMGVPLHHKDFSPVEDVVKRFGDAGWAVLEIHDPERLEQQYGIKQHLDLFILQS
jgi:O-methyltransferase involved in polyketide biosynthesis